MFFVKKTFLKLSYIKFLCKDHYAIFANGVLTETYFDAMNRGMFI